MLASMAVFALSPMWSGILLAFAIQTKVSALFLIPLFLWRSWNRGSLKQWSAGLVLGTIPTFLAQTKFEAVKAGFFTGRSALFYNPYYWNPWSPISRAWHPTWLTVGTDRNIRRDPGACPCRLPYQEAHRLPGAFRISCGLQSLGPGAVLVPDSIAELSRSSETPKSWGHRADCANRA